ncbi:unnamed protein product, partial [Iphiclides podalirius]
MEDCESETELKRNKDRSPSPGIKSTAVVKYTAFQSPVRYARLQCNTDLNLPPSNWGAAIDSYGLKQILTRGTGLSSFRMAHMFPDCVGEVDVISDAECIKKLLKLPYQPNGTVSMMVHRVENTLLLDDFDVYDYLMKSEWSWLKDFFYENIVKTMSEQERVLLTPGAGAGRALRLTQQFLSHSVAERPPPLGAPARADRTPVCLAGPFLPEPETKVEGPPNEHLHNRNVLWTFEDIRMLVGSDLPIFGDKDRPCVSLRLRDMREPINVLTGIDYWLDNLMCNVPEVLMCYHLDGIVQKYEPMKTEDLPNMEDSRFSPRVVRNVAQNILSFLKANATRPGHTYWLFKGPHDDVVKLYDLTSLCPEGLDNPFTTPVAMLLYRVARNMRMTNRSRHVKQLLEHVVRLLKAESYPQIVASSHYMLADLYVPATTNPACPDFKDESSDTDDEADFGDCAEFAKEGDGDMCERDGETGGARDPERVEITSDHSDKEDESTEGGGGEGSKRQEAQEAGDGERQLALRHIGDRIKEAVPVSLRPEGEGAAGGAEQGGLGAEVPERCGRALRHALQGLQALHHVTIARDKEEERERLKRQVLIEEQHPKMANPYEPIQMEYAPLRRRGAGAGATGRGGGAATRGGGAAAGGGRRRRREKRPERSAHLLVEATGPDRNAILVRGGGGLASWREPGRDDNFAWKLHLKTLLYEKICLAYATLAEHSYTRQQHGFSLKYIRMAARCQTLLGGMIIRSRVVDAGCLVGRAGDNLFQLSRRWAAREQYARQLAAEHETDARLADEIARDLDEELDGAASDEFEIDISLPSTEVEAMLRSCEHYRRAARVSGAKRGELMRRLASVCNELAVRFMNDAQQLYAQYVECTTEADAEAAAGKGTDTEAVAEAKAETDDGTERNAGAVAEAKTETKAKAEAKVEDKAEAAAEAKPEAEVEVKAGAETQAGMGAKAGAEAEDGAKAAAKGGRDTESAEGAKARESRARALAEQVTSLSRRSAECLDEASAIFEQVNDLPNLALLYCNKARYLRFKAHCDIAALGVDKRALYGEAEALYLSALRLLGPRDSCAPSIWELVSWELSCHLYTRAVLMQDCPGPQPHEASEVADAFKHALKYCLLSPGPRQYLYQFRAAMIYHRLGSLYHSQFRTTTEEGARRRALLAATRSNYEAAANLFAALEDAGMFLTVRLEHCAAMEAHAAVSPSLKLKSLQTAVQLLRQCHSVMRLLKERGAEERDQAKAEDGDERPIGSELSLLCLYENRLHYILRSIIQYCRSKSNKDYERMSAMYKSLYCVSLKIKRDEDVKAYAASICDVLTAMDEISKEYE